MSALDKILLLSGQSPAPSVRDFEDPAGDLVLAALSGLAELRVLLASSDTDDDDKDESSKGDNDNDKSAKGDTDDANDPDDDDDNDKSAKGDTDNDRAHLNHDTYKTLKKRGMSDAAAAKACARADKKIKASALAEAAVVALSGLATPQGNWVELTAFDHRAHVALAGSGGGKEPYGDVEYADPGYQKDGKKRYPLDTEGHVRAAWSYINQRDNAGEYDSVQLTSIKSKIKAAARKRGIQISDDGAKVAATMVALAARQEIGVAMHHGPHTGRHSHGHMHTVVANEEHYHNNDSDHSRHGVGTAQDRDW